VTDERATEYIRVKRSVVRWARQRPDIVGVAIVGSWARSQARMDSDIDFVLLTLTKGLYASQDDWVVRAVSQHADIVRTQEWGPLTERRVRLRSGLDIEFGFAEPSWASTDPVDPGTAQVVLDGCIPLVDQGGLFTRLIEAVKGHR
jgi:uncharacterized protein